MADLSVTYLGLKLKNPVVVSSSNLTGSVDGVKKVAEAGAGAVVLKSLFEEQIEHDTGQDPVQADYGAHPEAAEYIEQMGKYLGPRDYLDLIKQAKQETEIPIIASVNCRSPRWWTTFGEQIESAGADAIELNISMMPRTAQPSVEIEEEYSGIVRQVRSETTLPLAVKIGPYFTSMTALADSLVSAGASALVLFNRFYQLDIDVDDIALAPGYQFSAPEEIYTPLRWVSILAGQIECDLAGSTGVHTGKDVAKMLLAGADAVQICSTIYKHGPKRIGQITDELSAWMQSHSFDDIDAFRGRLSRAASEDPEAYERLQYIKALTGIA
jgi:dihydroorotate dehydrogenase (fumarate)